MLSHDGATKVLEGSKIVLGIDGDVRVLNVLNDRSLVLFGLDLGCQCLAVILFLFPPACPVP
jgi:hypothetical protein